MLDTGLNRCNTMNSTKQKGGNMDFQGIDYIDALSYESAATRYRESSLLIIGEDAKVKPGTDDYTRLSRMRFEAKKEIMGVSKNTMSHGFNKESYQHNSSEWRTAVK